MIKTWLITGASTGFGRALAVHALGRGDKVVLAVRQPETARSLTEEYPQTAAVVTLDVTRPESIAAAVPAAWECFGGGRVDVIVNNAGYGLLASLEETDDARLAHCLATNLIGPLQIMRAAVPLLRAQGGGGHIINNSAVAAFSNHVGFAVYGAAKAGLEAASDALAAEVAPFKIKVTLVVPGPFRTDFIGRSLDAVTPGADYANTVGKFGAYLQKIDGRQPGDPARAAAAICQAVDSEKPPARLVLGKYAHDAYDKKLKAMAAELAAWRETGLPTDFPV